MIKTNDGYCSINKIIGNDAQLTVTIPTDDWKYFNDGDKVKVISLKGKEFYRRIRVIGSGKQRNISIPKEEWADFNKGDKVKIFPEKQPLVSKSQSMDKQKNDKQISTAKHMPKLQ